MASTAKTVGCKNVRIRYQKTPISMCSQPSSQSRIPRTNSRPASMLYHISHIDHISSSRG